jgi:hypothetical protein
MNPAPRIPESLGAQRPDFRYLSRSGTETPRKRFRDNPKPPSNKRPENYPDPGDDLVKHDEPGNPGSGDDGGGGKDRTIYCPCCGCPWRNCMWCDYWSPMFWSYLDDAPDDWDQYWYPEWEDVFTEYHHDYNFEDHYPSIYTSAALILDPTSKALEYLDEGTNLFRQGEYMEALHLFRLATLADLNFAIPKFAYAHALFALGLYDYGAYEIRMGLVLLPEWTEMGGDLKLMYGVPDDFEEQLDALTGHLKVWPDDEDALLVLGYVSYFSGDLYMAEKVYQKLLKSTAADSAYTAGLFMESIRLIKERRVDTGNQDQIPPDDGITIDEILQR